ncbi:MAG: hypothetical protein N3A58_02760 [Spirochaetes bacterium]|nr:hypothetical protein [Spirochaetota bacterium]
MFPISTIYFFSFIIFVFSLIGIFIFKHSKDKIFMILPLIAQLFIIGVYFNIIKHIQNLFLICSAITAINFLIFLFAKDDKDKPYIYFILHFSSIFQLLRVIDIIK